MAMFENEGGSFVSLKQGEQVIATIMGEPAKKMIDMTDKDKAQYALSNKDYTYEIPVEVDGQSKTLTAGTWAFIKVMRESGAGLGDTILVKHLIGKGKWEIQIKGKPEAVLTISGDDDDSFPFKE